MKPPVERLLRRVCQRLADDMVRELVEAGYAPAEVFDVAVSVDIFGLTIPHAAASDAAEVRWERRMKMSSWYYDIVT